MGWLSDGRRWGGGPQEQAELEEELAAEAQEAQQALSAVRGELSRTKRALEGQGEELARTQVRY
jgi:hypothetical protein|eukprot:COSAG01_NODE_3685_length_5797_cov_4.035802_8_plen_64_part_00